MLQLSNGISEQTSINDEYFKSSFTFLENTLQERKDLSIQLDKAEKEKHLKLQEFKQNLQKLYEEYVDRSRSSSRKSQEQQQEQQEKQQQDQQHK